MISRIDEIEEIIPVFKSYLGYMSQFYDIKNVDAWRDNAIKNLQQDINAADQRIYTLKKSDVIIGFAVVNECLRFNHEGLAIAEFHIQKAYEKKGHGRRLAEHLFDRFPGEWEVAVTMTNESALLFWKQVVSSYTSGRFEEKIKSTKNEYGWLFKNE